MGKSIAERKNISPEGGFYMFMFLAVTTRTSQQPAAALGTAAAAENSSRA